MSLKSSFLLTVQFCASTYFALAQKEERIERLKNELQNYQGSEIGRIDIINQIGHNYYHLNFDSVFHYGHLGLSSAQEIDYREGIAEAYRIVGSAYIPWSRYDTALAYFDSSLQYIPKEGLEPTQSEVYKDMGIAYDESGRFEQAIAVYRNSQALKEPVEDWAEIGKVHNNMGQSFYNMGAYDSAVVHLMQALNNQAFLKAHDQGASTKLILGFVKTSLGEFEAAKALFSEVLDLLQLPDNIIMIASANGWLAKIFILEGDAGKALHYGRLSFEQFRSIRHLKGISGLTSILGEIYMLQQNYDSAIALIERSLLIKDEIQDVQYVSQWLTKLAECYEKTGNKEKALELGVEAARHAIEVGGKPEAAEAYHYLHLLSAQMGNYKKAYQYQSAYLAYQDSLLNEDKLKEIERLQTEYEVKQLALANERLEEEKVLQQQVYDADLQVKNLIQLAVILFAIVVIYVAIQYSSSYHQKNKANILMARQKRQLEELLSFKEGLTHMIAHDMKNSLNTIIGLSEGMKSDKMRNIGHSGRLMLNLVTNMLDVQKFQDAKIKLVKETVLVKDLFEDAHAQVILLMQTKSLRFESYVSNSLEVRVDKDIMVRVLVNLLTNAIKYSPNGRTIILKAQVSGIPNKPTAVLSVVDQGAGISKDKLPHIFDKYWQDNAGSSGKAASTGLGLTFAKLAVQSHQGKIAVVSQEEWGTSVNVHLPLPKDYVHVDQKEPKVIEPSNELILENEFEMIRPYVSRLSELEVYEIGAINAILSEMENDKMKSPWLSDLKAAVYQGNANLYQELLGQFNSPITVNN